MTTRRLPFALPALLLGAGLLVTPPAAAAAPEPDLTPPVITVPADVTAEATGASGAAVSYVDATANDDVDGPVPVTCVDQADNPRASGDMLPLGTTTITCTATDAANNTGQATFHVTVEDTTGPGVSVPDDATVQATGPTGAVVTYTPTTADDLVDGPLPVTCVDQADNPVASGDTYPLGTTTITCTATDTADNTGQASFTITVHDTTAPTVTVPSNKTVEATGPTGRSVTFTAPTADDLVDGPLPVTCVDQADNPVASGDTYPLGTTTITCTATDTADNTGQASFTITVHDTTAPTVTVPSNKTVEATGPTGRSVTFTAPTADDLVDGPLPVTCVDQADNPVASGDTYPLGTTTITCTATDTADNTGQASFTITVHDTTAPTVTVPSNKTVEATGPTGAVVTYTNASATDLVDGALPVTCLDQVNQPHPSGSTFPLGTTTMTCTATDGAANAGHATFTITVHDTTAPTVTVPTDKTVEATGPTGAVVTYTNASATDLVDGSVPPTCLDQASQPRASGGTFPLGTTTVTCTATDDAHNSAHTSFTVTVRDTTGPTVTVPSDIVREANGPNGRQTTFSAPTATDLVSGTRTVTCASQPTAGLVSGDVFPLGVTTLTCTATDAAGNQTQRSFTVTVRDTTKPTISGTPSNLQVEAVGPAGAPVVFSPPTATDLVDGPLTVSCDHASGSTFPLFSSPVPTTVTCSVTDAAHNTATSQFTVTVVDYTLPELVAPDSLSVPADSPLGASVELDVYAIDLVDGRIDADCTPHLAVYPIGTTTITCSVMDAWENEANSIFDLTVEGVDDPRITATVTSAKPKLHGWYRTPVTIAFTCAPGSSEDLDPCPEPVTLSTSGADQVVARTIHAADGGQAHVEVSIDLDTVKPTVRITKLSAKTPRCVASDALSGLDSCRLTHRKVGKKTTWTATGIDLAGNRRVVTATTRA